MILGCEGEAAEVERTRRACQTICQKHGGFALGRSVGRQWYAERFALPYLRDILLDHGVLTDTLETATVWSNVVNLHQRVAEAIADPKVTIRTAPAGSPDPAACGDSSAWQDSSDYARGLDLAIQAEQSEQLHPSYVMCHVSHTYPDGASLYFTFLAKQEPGHEIEQWQAIKHAATAAIMAHGGTLSHHHGVGYEHAPWLVAENGPLGLEVLKATKSALDPEGVMNPGKLVNQGLGIRD